MKEKVVLFDGTSLDAFVERDTGEASKWELKNGVITVTTGGLVSKEYFGDAHIHVEFNLPYMPDKEGQSRANSGVYAQGIYEVQVLDSYGKEPAEDDDCGAIYKVSAPITNACKAPGEWQTYDIYYRAAKLNPDGAVAKTAKLTVFLNGQIIQNNVELTRPTGGELFENTVVERGPLYLQDHGCPVRFRNIWVQPLD